MDDEAPPEKQKGMEEQELLNNEVSNTNAQRPSQSSSAASEKEASMASRPSFKEKSKPRKTGLFDFSNAEAMKDKVRSAKKQQPDAYDVKNFYWKEGFFQEIARHPKFENTTLGVIVVNALWISIDTDGNTAPTLLDAKTMYVFMDSAFFTYFSLEVIIRYLAFEKKKNCFKDGWFKFDSILVTLYAFDPFAIALMAKIQGGDGVDLPTAVLRLARLARLSRLVRMLRSLPELMIMIKGMVTASQSVVYTLGLLIIITYVIAIALRNLVPAAKSPEECAELWNEECIEILFFSSVPEAMHNLMIFATYLDELGSFMFGIKQESPACLILAWLYLCLASLTVLNMLVGVLCEIISAVAAEEQETMIVDKVHEKLGQIVQEADENNDGTMSWDEFKTMMEHPEAIAAMESVNVSPESLIDIAEDVFFDEGQPVALSFDDFMNVVLDLRGGQQATVHNILGLGKRMSSKFLNLNTRMDSVEGRMALRADRISDIESKLDDILDHLTGKKEGHDMSVTSVP